MREHRKLEVALDAIAGQFGLLVAAAERPAHARNLEIVDAVRRAEDAFAAVNSTAAALEEDADLPALTAVWESIAAAQDQIRRAEELVRQAYVVTARCAEIKDAAAQTVAESRRGREERRPALLPGGLTVLIVDDVAETRLLYTTYFEHAGAQVLGAGNGADALVCLDAQRPDVVLLDLAMPGSDGWDTLAALRGDPRWREIPIAILSGNTDPADREAARVAGADLFLTKPCLPHVVFRRLVQLAGRHT